MGEVLSLAQNNTFVRAEQDQFAPVEAVADQYEQGMLGRIAEGAQKFGNIVKRGGAVMLGSLALGGAAEGTINTESAYGTSVSTNVTEVKGNTTVSVGGSTMTDEAYAKATVLANHRVVSKAKIQKAKKEKRCKTVDGSEQEVWTEGLSGNGTRYGRDKRESLMCKVKINGKNTWIRAVCGNRVRFQMPKKAVPGRAIWVNTLNNANVKVTSTAVAKAEADCKTATSSAKASGYGEASAYGKISYKASIKSKSLDKLIVSKKLSASAEAKAKASATASATCSETITTPPPVVTPTKDGTQTPPPPANAPGPNPAPSPEEPFPGGYPCYSETTGAPVPAKDGLCPAGSYGQV